VPRPEKSFRVGVFRKREYKPIATVGVSADGGIWISPAPVKNHGWQYGVSREGAEAIADPPELVRTPLRPKLHYHQSGRAFVTLTGQDLERRVLELPSVGTILNGQIFSVVAVRPWELATAPSGTRKGDFATVHARWPDSVAFTFSILRLDELTEPDESGSVGLEPFGLIPGDDSFFTVNLSSYFPKTVLLGRTHFHDEPSHHTEASITVAALPWDPSRELSSRGTIILSSDQLRNPEVAHIPADQMLTPALYRKRMATGEIISGTVGEHVARIYGSGTAPPSE
jgi:hypothetical protein